MPSNITSAIYAFNLICTYTHYGNESEELKEIANPYITTYRLDLNSKKYCEDDCYDIKSIHSINKNYIYLENEESYNPVFIIKLLKINRINGKVESVMAIDKENSISFGSCEKDLFSGFPRKKF